MGLSDEIIGSLQGYSTTTRSASYAEVLMDIDKLGNFLNKNPNTSLENFDRVINIFKRNDKVGNNYKQGVHWMIRDLSSNGSLFAGKKLKFEHSIKNARPTEANSFIDLFCINCTPANLKVEYKSGPGSISSFTIKEQFIERDLFNANSLDEIQWRMEGTEMNKEELVSWMMDNKDSIENLKYDKIKSFFPNDNFMTKDNFADRFISKFNDESFYNSIFK